MKVLTFFTVRGGSGKTVLSAAFASYVSYILGKRAMVKNSIAMKREMGAKGFLRSTVCFPEKEIRAKNPGIINLFEEIVRYEERGVQKAEDS